MNQGWNNIYIYTSISYNEFIQRTSGEYSIYKRVHTESVAGGDEQKGKRDIAYKRRYVHEEQGREICIVKKSKTANVSKY